MKRTALLLVPVALSLGVLAGCSSGTTSDDEPSAVGGTAVCDEPALKSAVDETLSASPDSGKLFSLDGFECADGWAVTFPTAGTTEENAYTYTQVFEAEGQFWVPIADRNTVCGTFNPDDPSAYPSDSQVPESIWQPACNTN